MMALVVTGRASKGSVDEEERANWGMLTLAWAVYFGFGVVSASLPVLIGLVRQELGLSYAQVGIVLGAWQLAYILMSYPAGRLVDAIGPRRALVIGAALVAASAFGRGLAGTFPALVLAVAVFGCGGPIVSVGLPKVMAGWFSGRPRAVAVGIYTTGSAAGNVIALAATNSLVLPLAGSWRATCWIYGALVTVLGAIWWARAADPPRRAPAAAGGAAAWHAVLGTRAVWLVVIVGFTGFMTGHGFRSWLPQILESRGMAATTAGYLAALPALSGIAGSILTARLAARVGRRRVVMALLVGIAGTLLSVTTLRGASLVTVLVLEGFCAGAVLPLLLSILMDLREVGAAAMGTAAGAYFALGEIGGFAGPALMGVLKDATGSFTAGLAALAAITLAMLLPAARLPKG